MLGWVFFAGHDPVHYGNVGQAMLTLFVMLTLENFPDNVYMGQEVRSGRSSSSSATPSS
jgi:voltage-gated sodium channel